MEGLSELAGLTVELYCDDDSGITGAALIHHKDLRAPLSGGDGGVQAREAAPAGHHIAGVDLLIGAGDLCGAGKLLCARNIGQISSLLSSSPQ